MKSIVIVDDQHSWLREFLEEMNSNNYETIIINSFIHSLPDVRFYMLKLIYQIYQCLEILEKKRRFPNIFKKDENIFIATKNVL